MKDGLRGRGPQSRENRVQVKQAGFGGRGREGGQGGGEGSTEEERDGMR